MYFWASKSRAHETSVNVKAKVTPGTGSPPEEYIPENWRVLDAETFFPRRWSIPGSFKLGYMATFCHLQIGYKVTVLLYKIIKFINSIKAFFCCQVRGTSCLHNWCKMIILYHFVYDIVKHSLNQVSTCSLLRRPILFYAYFEPSYTNNLSLTLFSEGIRAPSAKITPNYRPTAGNIGAREGTYIGEECRQNVTVRSGQVWIGTDNIGLKRLYKLKVTPVKFNLYKRIGLGMHSQGWIQGLKKLGGVAGCGHWSRPRDTNIICEVSLQCLRYI